MQLFEAIMAANHRALAGDGAAGVHPADFAESLPVAALTCIDARLNPLFPDVLGLAKEHFIWLRNAGNIITGPMSSTMRSLALACAVKGAREIAVIGHTDCLVRKTSMMQLTEAFRALGVERGGLPENLTEFFGLFASERQNVKKAAEFVRQSPLIGPRVPVHGLMVDIATGKLEWVVNGYQTLETAGASRAAMTDTAVERGDGLKPYADFKMGEMKFPDMKIGEITTGVSRETAPEARPVEKAAIRMAVPTARVVPPPRIPAPPRVKQR